MPPGDRDRSRIDDVALDPVGEQQAINSKPVQSRFLNDDRFDRRPIALLGLRPRSRKKVEQAAPSPPSTTCLENFSLPGLLIVTTHFDLLNSSEANNVISFARTVVATAVAEVTDFIGCLHCSPFWLRPHGCAGGFVRLGAGPILRPGDHRDVSRGPLHRRQFRNAGHTIRSDVAAASPCTGFSDLLGDFARSTGRLPRGSANIAHPGRGQNPFMSNQRAASRLRRTNSRTSVSLT